MSRSRTSKAPASAKRASTIEHADATVAVALGEHHAHPVVAALGMASEVADQPPMIALTGATALAGFALGKPALARAGLRMLASELVATGIKTRVKRRVDRTRPQKMLEDGRYVLKPARDGAGRDGPWSSFPSGHTAGAVAVSRALVREYPALAGPATVAAATIAAIQLPRRAHFPTDVIAGAAIGWAAEMIVDAALRMVTQARTNSSVVPDRPPPAAR